MKEERKHFICLLKPKQICSLRRIRTNSQGLLPIIKNAIHSIKNLKLFYKILIYIFKELV